MDYNQLYMKKQSTILIKRAILKNIPEIVGIHRKCVLETNAKFYHKNTIKEWAGQISNESVKNQFKNSSWYILKIDNRIIGFAQFSIKDRVLYQINIDPKYQRKSYGKILYEFIEKKFKKNKIRKISLNSTLNAVKFYKSLGFKSLGKIRFELDKEYAQMIKMEKIL